MGQDVSVHLTRARVSEAFNRKASNGELSAQHVDGVVEELLMGSGVDVAGVVGAIKKAGGGGIKLEEFERRLMEALGRGGEKGNKMLSQSMKDVARGAVADAKEKEEAEEEVIAPAPPAFDPEAAEKRGHVFLLLTDLRRLQCECWALPVRWMGRGWGWVVCSLVRSMACIDWQGFATRQDVALAG